MTKLPRHPDLATLAALEPDIGTVPAGTQLFRIYRRGGAHPTRWSELRYFGPTSARFDHHLPDANGAPTIGERGISYVSSSVTTALAEVFQVDRAVDTVRGEPWLVGFELARDVNCLDLSGAFALRAGASMQLVSGPRSISQNWSRGFYENFPNIEGVLYPSSMTNTTVYAFYERVDQLGVPLAARLTVHRQLGDPTLHTALKNACREIGYVLLPAGQR